MAQKEPHGGRTETSLPPNLMSAEPAETVKQRVDEFGKAQTELLDKFQEANRQWLERMQREAELTSEFASKLTAARSIPETMSAWQEWTRQRLEMMGEDGKHLLADMQSFMETGARLMPSGSLWRSPGSST
jgi:Phasin protein